MASVIHLQQGHLRCDLAPSTGGSVLGLWVADKPVLRATPWHARLSALDTASYPLVPYSNRIGQARFQWAGQSYALTPNFPPEPHAIHGVGWQVAWSVQAADATSTTWVLHHQADANWPFDFVARQHIQLVDQGLVLRSSVTNLHSGPAPFGLGWHPYLIKQPESHLHFAATGRWEMGADQLPTHLVPHPGLDRPVEGLTVDHCFEGWTGPVHVRSPDLQVRIASSLDRLVVYTRPEIDCIALEPVSHVNNALNRLGTAADHFADQARLLGVRILAPGQTMTGHMTIECR